MELEKKHSQKWIDETDSDQSSEEELTPEKTKNNSSEEQNFLIKEDHTSVDYIKRELIELQEKYSRGNDCWLYLECENVGLLKRKVKFLSEQKDIIHNFPSKENPLAITVKTSKLNATKYLKQGLDEKRVIKIKVHINDFRKENNYKRDSRNYKDRDIYREEYNGERRDRRDRRDKGQRRDRGDRGDRGDRRDRKDRDGKKKVFINKETGEKSNAGEKKELRNIEDRERKYSKRQAQEIGQSLNFRKNSKVEEGDQVQDVPASNFTKKSSQQITELTLGQKKSKEQPKKENAQKWKRFEPADVPADRDKKEVTEVEVETKPQEKRSQKYQKDHDFSKGTYNNTNRQEGKPYKKKSYKPKQSNNTEKITKKKSGKQFENNAYNSFMSDDSDENKE